MSERTSPRREDIDVTDHAVEQYRARSRLGLDHAGTRCELCRLGPSGEVRSAAPEWAGSAGTTPLYLVIGHTLALPLAAQNGRWVVTTTCLVKTTITERQREKARRASAKRPRRASAKGARRRGGAY